MKISAVNPQVTFGEYMTDGEMSPKWKKFYQGIADTLEARHQQFKESRKDTFQTDSKPRIEKNITDEVVVISQKSLAPKNVDKTEKALVKNESKIIGALRHLINLIK